MSPEEQRVRITCPECDGFIVSAPEDELPTGDLVCPNCGAVVKAPTQFDKLVEDVKDTFTDPLGSTDEQDKSG